MRAALALLAGLAVTMTAAGCARTATPADEARGALQTFLAACAHGDAQTALETVSPGARPAFLAAGPPTLAKCQAVVPFGVRASDPAALEGARGTAGVDARGDEATVPVRLAGGRTVPVGLEETAEGWRVTGAG
jgi:hypothetical protein